MRTKVVKIVAGLVVVGTVVLGHAAEEQVPWYHDSVILLIGPRSESELPEGKTTADVLRDIQPDVAEWSYLPALEGVPGLPRGVGSSIEWQEFPQYQQQLDDWLERMGEAWEPTELNGRDRDSDGNLLPARKYGSEYPTTMYGVTQFSPKYHQYHIADQLIQASKPGVGLVRQDNLGWSVGLDNSGGWGYYTLAAFREWLFERKTPQELKDLGIEDLHAWDLRDALKECYGDLSSPLLREYIVFFNVSNTELWRDHVRAVQNKFPDMPVGANQCHTVGLFPYRFAMLSEVSDFLFIETGPGGDLNLHTRLLLAGGRHSKPVWTWINGASENSYYLAWANGSTPYLDLCALRLDGVKGYHWLPKIPAEQYDRTVKAAAFAQKYREYLRPAFRAEADVAIIYSVPTMLYPACQAMGLSYREGEFTRTKDLINASVYWCVRYNSQWNFEIFGHPEAWEDRDLDARLSRYKMLILPNIAAISDAQYAALKRFEGNGGKIAVIGDFGLRRETYEAREVALPSPDNIGLKPSKGFEAFEEAAFKEALGRYSFVCSDPGNIRVNIFPKGNAYQIHFGTVSSAFTMEWPLPGDAGTEWTTTWVSPDEESSGVFEIRDGALFGSVKVKGWGFVHCEPK